VSPLRIKRQSFSKAKATSSFICLTESKPGFVDPENLPVRLEAQLLVAYQLLQGFRTREAFSS
jgi:hypothetical protein